jgi:hypothetical protein
MEKFGSGINIPDPQHWLTRNLLLWIGIVLMPYHDPTFRCDADPDPNPDPDPSHVGKSEFFITIIHSSARFNFLSF